ncbi:MAG: hypothetical protein V1800_18800 [Candidatus Latescibacterota bacterium]
MWIDEATEKLRQEAEALDLFDASSWLGRASDFPLMKEGTPALLAETHQKAYIHGALISHWLGSEDGSQASNQLLLEEIAGHDHWYAILALQPLLPADPGSPGCQDWIWPERTRAVRVFPNTFRYALVDWCVGTLCELLIEKQMPLFVFHTETTFQDLYGIAQRYPDLQIVLESQVRKILYHTRMVLPLLRACPNIALEISNFCGQGMIEYTVNALGPERLLFGTFAPANDPLVPLGMLLQANISEEAKRAIAGSTIRHMISEVRL